LPEAIRVTLADQTGLPSRTRAHVRACCRFSFSSPSVAVPLYTYMCIRQDVQPPHLRFARGRTTFPCLGHCPELRRRRLPRRRRTHLSSIAWGQFGGPRLSSSTTTV
jgi:hypothetical protein